MCDVQELRRRDHKECEGKGDTGRLGRRKEKQETARRTQGDAGNCKEDAGRHRRPQGRCRETQGDAGN